MIKVEGLSKGFKVKGKNKPVLKNLSFQAEPGQIYGLLGPNGAGKTTTLRLIATLLKPDHGKITVNGFDTVKEDRKVRDITGLLTSDMKLTGNLTPREFLQFFGELNHLSTKQIKESMDRLVSYLDMGDFLDKPAEKLSTGMKQKTSIAISLIHDPQVIMFDEPTNGLDILASKVVIDFLNDYKKQGKTVILSTHIMAEAEKLCDKLGIILNGELVEDGSKDDILQKHGSPSLEEVFYNIAAEKGVIQDA